MRALLGAAALCFAPFLPASAQETPNPAAGSSSTASSCPAPATLIGSFTGPMATVRYLADDALEGRLAGSQGAHCAGDFIAARFARLGLAPAGEDGTYFQSVSLASILNPHGPQASEEPQASEGAQAPGAEGVGSAKPASRGRNVIARLPGADPALRDEVVVIGAHYDHLGRGGFGTMNPADRGQIHNGADDNASGVGVLLQVAEALAHASAASAHTGAATSRGWIAAPARSVVFIAFTGEEEGLLGSAYYAAHPTLPLEKTVAMLNMDMVGRLGTAPLIVNGIGTAQEWRKLVTAANADVGLELAFGESGYGPTDQTSFYAKGIPVLHFFTNVHGDYHRPTDDWEKIDAAGMERIGRLVAGVATRAANLPERLTLKRQAKPVQADSDAGHGAYLGSIPDFTPVERGVLLSGVGPGSPAEKAGLEGGDTIVGLGEFDIGDLYDLTDALRAHKPGDAVRVTVLRGGEEQTFEVVLGSRSERRE